jgi:hypothetical protein
VAIYANDHPPPHEHAIRRDGASAKLALNCPHGPVTLVGQRGFRAVEIVEIGNAVAADLDRICTRWGAIHG